MHHQPPIDPFWIQSACDYSEAVNASASHVLHPAIRQLVESYSPKRVLDYSCGDARLWIESPVAATLHLFDPSPAMLSRARGRFSSSDGVIVHQFASDIPSRHFDVVVSSLVLMTLRSESELDVLLEHMADCLAPDGILLVGVTHPCFRSVPFSDFETSFARGKRFDYFAEGTPFDVELRDRAGSQAVSFVDYHYSLQRHFQAFQQARLYVESLRELRDLTFGSPIAPPFLLMALRRVPNDNTNARS